jgi:hypothetical protein
MAPSPKPFALRFARSRHSCVGVYFGRGPTSSLRFVVSKQPVALVVAKFQQRATVGMYESCRIYRGRVVLSIYVSLCDDSDVVIDGIVGRSSQNDLSPGNIRVYATAFSSRYS